MMVRKMAKNGTYYHEAPYTDEEVLELYRAAASGPFTVLRQHPTPPAGPKPQSTKPPRPSGDTDDKIE